MSRVSEVRSMQQEREKNIEQNVEPAELKDIYNVLERLNGNIEDISNSLAILVDIEMKKLNN